MFVWCRLQFLSASIAGNLKQLYDRQGWDFHRQLAEAYGTVSVLHGKFGVRSSVLGGQVQRLINPPLSVAKDPLRLRSESHAHHCDKGTIYL